MTVHMVKDVFGISRRGLTDGLIGLEIEVEGRRFFEPRKYWTSTYDGSLRDGREYVFSKPLSLVDTKKALTYFARSATLNNMRVNDSVRAGVHVHVNVQDLSMLHLMNMITLFSVFEEMLTAYCGETRDGNLFCLRTKDAEFLNFSLIKCIRDKDFSSLSDDNIRYAALNLNSLSKFGSLEFRSMRTPHGKGMTVKIFNWIRVVAKLKESCVNYADPTEILEKFSGVANLEFLSEVFGDLTEELVKVVPDYEGRVYYGMRNAQDIAYCDDWSWFKKEAVVNPFKSSARAPRPTTNQPINVMGGSPLI